MIDEDTRTIWCGNLHEKVTEDLIYELFLQAGPLEKVRIPKDRDGRQRNFAFITYCHDVSVPYALRLLRGTILFNRALNIQSRGNNVDMQPPVRNIHKDTFVDISSKTTEKFMEMTSNIINNEKPFELPSNLETGLTRASLQGNWSHKHHPYMKNMDERKPKGHNDYHDKKNNHNRYNDDRRNKREGHYNKYRNNNRDYRRYTPHNRRD